MKRYVIYIATCLINNKVYIGQTRDLPRRKSAHKRNAFKLLFKDAFHSAIRKYGWKMFQWRIIGECQTRDELNDMEPICVEFYHSLDRRYGYNTGKGGLGHNGCEGNKNNKWKEIDTTDLVKDFQSMTWMELQTKYNLHKRMLRQRLREFMTEEEIHAESLRRRSERTSRRLKGKVLSQEACDKLSLAHKGKHFGLWSQERKQQFKLTLSMREKRPFKA